MATVRAWVRQLGEREFVYTIKVSELITHVKRFTGTKTLVREFCHVADLLGPRIGCVLFQLPPSFHYTRAHLHRILSQLDPARRKVVEFRHRSWWTETVFTAFRNSGTIFCSCNGLRLPEELEIYVRLDGIKHWYRHDYISAEISVWADRIRERHGLNLGALQ